MITGTTPTNEINDANGPDQPCEGTNDNEDDDDGDDSDKQVTLTAAAAHAHKPAHPEWTAKHLPGMTDGHAYLGEHAFKHVTATAFTITDRLDESYITTASLRRSGCHPQPGELGDSPDQPAPLWEHSKEPHMDKLKEWIQGNTQPHSAKATNKLINIDKVRILHLSLIHI